MYCGVASSSAPLRLFIRADANETASMDQPRQQPTNDFSLLTPATVLLYVALAVGIFITFCFIFFTFRYFVRAKYGLHVYGLARRRVGFPVGEGADAQWEFITNHREYLVAQLHLRFITHHGQLVTPRGGRRRNNRFAKMKKLTTSQVEELFPEKTYRKWLQTDVDDAASEMIVEEVPTAEAPDIGGKTVPVKEVAVTEELRYSTNMCAICLEGFEDDDCVRGLLCGHPFHKSCVDPWLTRHRACCPLCKRDYYQRQQEGNTAAPDNALDYSIDLEAFRDDPDVRMLLTELIPPQERVDHLMRNPRVQELGIESRAEAAATVKYGHFLKRLWWMSMGISKNDLKNWVFLQIYQSEINEAEGTEMRDMTEVSVEATHRSGTGEPGMTTTTTGDANQDVNEERNDNGDSDSVRNAREGAEAIRPPQQAHTHLSLAPPEESAAIAAARLALIHHRV